MELSFWTNHLFFIFIFCFELPAKEVNERKHEKIEPKRKNNEDCDFLISSFLIVAPNLGTSRNKKRSHRMGTKTPAAWRGSNKGDRRFTWKKKMRKKEEKKGEKLRKWIC